MDSLWQRHRTFILKILAGLGVCFLAWIIGSSLSEGDLDTQKGLVAKHRNTIKGMSVHSESSISGFVSASDALRARIAAVANQVGETRTEEDLRLGLLREILALVDKDTPAARNEFLQLSRLNPKSCLNGLLSPVRQYLTSEAALRSVFLDEELGFDRVDLEAGQLDRYLLTMKLIIQAVKMGIEEGAFEVKQIGILSPPGSRFEGEATFLKEYPVGVTYRGSSASLLRILDRLSSPDRFYVVRALRRFQKDRQEREEDVMVMEIELSALRIMPEAELVTEGRR